MENANMIYTIDNTENYSQAQIDRLNRRAIAGLTAANLPVTEAEAVEADVYDAWRATVERIENGAPGNMTQITFNNDFHGTSHTVTAIETYESMAGAVAVIGMDDLDAVGPALCDADDCMCGGGELAGRDDDGEIYAVTTP